MRKRGGNRSRSGGSEWREDVWSRVGFGVEFKGGVSAWRGSTHSRALRFTCGEGEGLACGVGLACGAGLGVRRGPGVRRRLGCAERVACVSPLGADLSLPRRLHVIISSSHRVIVSSCHRVIMSSCHHVSPLGIDLNLPRRIHVIISSCHRVIVSSCHHVIMAHRSALISTFLAASFSFRPARKLRWYPISRARSVRSFSSTLRSFSCVACEV